MPTYIPSKTRLPDATNDFTKSKEGYISPFKGYNAEKLGPITGPTTFIAQYDTEQNMREVESPTSYFFSTNENNEIYLTLNSNVVADAITIPSTWNGKVVRGLNPIPSEVRKHLRRIFVSDDNQITKIAQSFSDNNSVLDVIEQC